MSGRQLQWVVYAVCILITLAMRLPYLGAPLGVDEGGDALIAKSWSTTHGSMYGSFWLDRSPVLLTIYKLALFGGDLGVRVLGIVASLALIGVVMAIARQISTPRAACIAGLLTAPLASSVLLGAVFTTAELLAVVPSALSVVALLRALDSPSPQRWFALAGASASAALLIKLSFIDAALAGACCLGAAVAARRSTGIGARSIATYLTAFVAPILLVLSWVHLYSVPIRAFVYALVGFRISNSTTPAQTGGTHVNALLHLGIPIAIASGTALLAPWAVAQLWSLRRRKLTAITLGAWLLAGAIGVMGGGSYFPHYFIELIPSLAVLGGCALARTGHRTTALVTAMLMLVLIVGGAAGGAALKRTNPPQARTMAVASYLRTNARSGDSLYVMYARANLLYYSGMRAAFRYNWSLMMRTMPAAEPRMLAMLESPRARPTWIVEWQQPDAFGLDSTRATRHLLTTEYRLAAIICGKPVLIRRDGPARRLHDPVGGIDCQQKALPANLVGFVSKDADEADGIDYLWQG